MVATGGKRQTFAARALKERLPVIWALPSHVVERWHRIT